MYRVMCHLGVPRQMAHGTFVYILLRKRSEYNAMLTILFFFLCVFVTVHNLCVNGKTVERGFSEIFWHGAG